jgi:hypothetical protein
VGDHSDLIERARRFRAGLHDGPPDDPWEADAIIAELLAALAAVSPVQPGDDTGGLPRNAAWALLLAAEDAMLPCPFPSHHGGRCGPCRALSNARRLLTAASPVAPEATEPPTEWCRDDLHAPPVGAVSDTGVSPTDERSER